MNMSIPFNKWAHLKFSSVWVLTALLSVGLAEVAQAEDKTWEVKAGDSLGKVVAGQYPGYSNRTAIMQEILSRNPDVFLNNDMNRLIVGKTLKLPAPDEIPELEAPAPKPEKAGNAGSESQDTLQSLKTQVAEQKETIAMLEEENASLQEMVKGYAEAKSAAGADSDDLQKQLDSTKQELQASQTKAKTLEEQLAGSKHENEALQNDLQQIRAAAAVAEDKDSASSILPWSLLGLLALLTLPLIWLLRRKQGQALAPAPLAAKVETPGEVAPITSPVPAAQMVEEEESNTVSIEENQHQIAVAAATPGNPDADLKLNIARAYLDLRDSEAAADILQDVLVEGGEQQRQEAREILSFIT